MKPPEVCKDPAILRACIFQVHGEIANEKGRPPTMKEIVEVAGVSAITVRFYVAQLKLQLTDGRALRYKGRKEWESR